jgi:hypothetical protein
MARFGRVVRRDEKWFSDTNFETGQNTASAKLCFFSFGTFSASEKKARHSR